MSQERPERKIKLDLALVHYPVCNKNGETIGSAVTNLDLHDIARASKTFGVDTLYIVTPFEEQRHFVEEILDHWLHGYGARYNINRKEALSLVQVCEDIQTLYALVTEKWRQRPTILATSAKSASGGWTYEMARQRIFAGDSFLILFGTGWGLTAEVLDDLDGLLPPINGRGDYNHLSVRSAAAVVLDRLTGRE
ncbi:MAG: RNA methyltransferase [Proteobacteria bacterium]|nr:RNA methyltransferase [Pseudomonadota bacterium]MBU1710997.1 RNA methyltransferase [Pseudomonadota bacterium]